MRADPSARRGPTLPYSLVAGVTPCRGGWLVAAAKLQGTIFSPEDPIRVDSFIEVVDMRPAYSSSPSTLQSGVSTKRRSAAEPATGKQEPFWADVGPPSRVHRSTLNHRTARICFPDHVDAITRTLLPRYQEVANEMAPFRQRTIYEVNADLSFFQLNGDVPMRWSKYSEKGMDERRAFWSRSCPVR